MRAPDAALLNRSCACKQTSGGREHSGRRLCTSLARATPCASQPRSRRIASPPQTLWRSSSALAGRLRGQDLRISNSNLRKLEGISSRPESHTLVAISRLDAQNVFSERHGTTV